MPQSPHSETDPVQTSWPDLTCYGCGPANEVGLHLESYLGEDGETLVATVQPDEIFNSGAPNVMYGGHIASLIDCHSIWTAIVFAYIAENRQLGSSPRIAYVTGELCVDYLAPTPLDRPIELTAWVDGDPGKRTRVKSELGLEDEITATGEVLAVRIKPPDIVGHHQG
ncbi:PaaI family thioesterase [Salinigranum halophilum]|uniref:PaaI family thioesterase n=1 Tax=Salinigranum halophilum TaxID=2565931 RepID=UPI0010A86D46|nr:hotdog fold domain-containing protein [Salinigranum halophilum]